MSFKKVLTFVYIDLYISISSPRSLDPAVIMIWERGCSETRPARRGAALCPVRPGRFFLRGDGLGGDAVRGGREGWKPHRRLIPSPENE